MWREREREKYIYIYRERERTISLKAALGKIQSALIVSIHISSIRGSRIPYPISTRLG